MRGISFLSLLLVVQPIASQQIWDVYTTTWDRTKLFTNAGLSASINFGTPGAAKNPDIQIQDGTLLQTMAGFGATLTDSSALVLNNLKSKNSGNYNNLLNTMFNPTYGANAAGLNYIRVSIGASDFSAGLYSLDDTKGDTSFNNFNINAIPSYLFSVLNDIRAVNPNVKVHILPWSPPGWMKDSGTMNGGSILSQYVSAYPTYLLKAVQGFQSKGIPIYAVSIQNEPQNSNPTYPTCLISASQMATIGSGLRTLLNNNGLSGVKIIGYEHNWDNAGTYPVQMMQSAPNAFAGVAFHCYAGSVSQQANFVNAYPNKEVYFTECSGTIGSDWWSDIKWYMDNLWIGSVERNAKAGLMWNFALDGNGNPKLPGTDSCGGPGCRPLVTVNSDGSYSFNQEFYSMAQASKAIIPKDPGGPFGQRIGVTVSGSLAWTLRVSAFVTKRANAADWNQYSIVVLNWYDNSSSSWNPTPVTATIEFRGAQVTYTFPVGVTTLWWFAAPTGSVARSLEEGPVYVNSRIMRGQNSTLV